jgi:hypothetical protein
MRRAIGRANPTLGRTTSPARSPYWLLRLRNGDAKRSIRRRVVAPIVTLASAVVNSFRRRCVFSTQLHHIYLIFGNIFASLPVLLQSIRPLLMSKKCTVNLVEVFPGDVILMSGLSPVHRMVQKLTHSRWSQVGLVIIGSHGGESILLEATSIPLSPDTEDGSLSPGVRTTSLTAKLRCFEGVAVVRRLRPALDNALCNELAVFKKSVRHRPFEFSLLYSRRSIRRSHCDWNSTSFTCSSLVAAAYQHIGVMARPPEGPFPSNVLPGDFSQDGRVTLAAGYSLDHEIMLQR